MYVTLSAGVLQHVCLEETFELGLSTDLLLAPSNHKGRLSAEAFTQLAGELET